MPTTTKPVGEITSWHYMADMWYVNLDDIIESKTTTKKSIALGAYHDTVSFFRMTAAHFNGAPANPRARRDTYEIATDIIHQMPQHHTRSIVEIETLLAKYQKFTATINTPRRCSDEDVRIATSLQEFMLHLRNRCRK